MSREFDVEATRDTRGRSGLRQGIAAVLILSAALACPAPAQAESEAFRPTFDAALPESGALPPVPGPALVPKLAMPGAWPAIEIRTILVGLHLLGLCFGLGGATMLDFWILRWIRWGHLPDNLVRTFEFVGKAVSAGLVLLWTSGAGFLVLYGLFDPAKLANPKIAAKLVIVAALSINGIVVHRLVLPYVARGRGSPLFDGFGRRRILFVLTGALSGVSWYAAFALGLLHEFNGRVPAFTLLATWLTLVLLSTAVMEVLLVLAPALRPSRIARGDALG